jgi:hypothetical protein
MATLNINIMARNSASTALGNIRQDINAVGDAAPGASRGLMGMADALGKIGLGVLGLTALAGALQDVMSSMFAGNAEMERYEVQLGVLLGGADKAKERLAELAEFGAKTPFELPEVVKAEKVLLGFGLTAERALNMTGKSSTDLRTIIGDIAAGTGTSFEEIALNFGKFSAGMTGDVLSRFAELGIVTREQLAGMGIEFSKSGELLSPLPDAMKAITQLTEGRFGGMMDKMSMTFEGQMSTLSDNFNAAKRVLMQPLFDVVRDSLGSLNGLLSSGAVQDGLASVADTIAGVVSQAIEGSKQLGSALAPAIQLAGRVFAAEFTIMQTTAAAVWDFIVPKVQTAVTVIQAVIGTAITAASEVWRDRGDAILSQAQYIWSETEKTVREMVAPIAPFIEEQFGQIVAWTAENWPLIESTIRIVMQGIGQNVEVALRAIAAFWADNGETVKAVLGAAWEIIKVTIGSGLEIVLGLIKAAMQVINGDFSGAFDTITRVIETWGQATARIIDVATGGMVTKIANATAAAISAFMGMGNNVTGTMNALGNSINSAVETIRGYLQSFADKTSVPASALGVLRDAGQAAFDWFAGNTIPFLQDISGAIAWSEGPKGMLDKLRDTGSSVKAWFDGNVFPFVESITSTINDSVLVTIAGLTALAQDLHAWLTGNVFGFRETIADTVDGVYDTVDSLFNRLYELWDWLRKVVFGIVFSTSGASDIPAAGLTLGRSASLAMAGTAGGVQQSAPTMRPIEITVVLDGQVVGRAAWNYMKRQQQLGAAMGL